MRDMDNQNKTEQPEKRRGKNSDRKGFYLALAVCVAAIGIAAWSTYDTVSNFLEPENTGTNMSSPSAAATRRPAATLAPNTIEDPERYVGSGHGQGTADEVTVTPQTTETPAPTEAPAAAPVEPDPEPQTEPAAAKPEYTESDSFALPVSSGEILSPFSDAPVYSATMRDYRAHMGADYAASHGETVRSAANGIVLETYTDMLRGNIIVIEHGDYEISYCGLGETFLVAPGEVVSQGQDIGSVTAAPYESAMDPHLHIEVRQNGEAVDPAVLIG